MDLLLAGIFTYAIISITAADTPKKRLRDQIESTLFDQAVDEWRRKNRDTRD